jgi:hypothetical protein
MRLVRRERERIDVHIFNPSIPHCASSSSSSSLRCDSSIDVLPHSQAQYIDTRSVGGKDSRQDVGSYVTG